MIRRVRTIFHRFLREGRQFSRNFADRRIQDGHQLVDLRFRDRIRRRQQAVISPHAVGPAAAGIGDEPLRKGPCADQGIHLESGIKGFFRISVFDELHPGEKPQPADIPDDGVSVQRLQPLQ